MLDEKIPSRPRVALVFGDEGSAGHLRDAVSGHVEIVYEASAADFDVSRLAVSQATAALVNLDDCESLDAVETRLQETGVAVVFNDPEISSKLDGWAQARWLRHLTAKLSGNSDFDPPRPVAGQTASAVPEAAPETQIASEAPATVAAGVDGAPQFVERPLSPSEIESMTADFVAVQEASAPQLAGDDGDSTPPPRNADAGSAASMALAIVETGNETASPALAPDAVDTTTAMPEVRNEHGSVDVLDVDTEALSAMIDARLAAAGGEPVPESPEVWRVIEGGSVSAVELPSVEPEPAATASGTVPQPAATIDDDDVLKALPSLDDWQLVDPEAPAAPAQATKLEERDLSALSIDFAGLELVPVETAVPVELNSEPIERWMHVSDKKDEAGGKTKPATTGSKGERS